MSSAFARELKRRRIAKELTHAEMGRRTGASKSIFSHYERVGKPQAMSFLIAVLTSSVLDWPIDEMANLMTESDLQ